MVNQWKGKAGIDFFVNLRIVRLLLIKKTHSWVKYMLRVPLAPNSKCMPTIFSCYLELDHNSDSISLFPFSDKVRCPNCILIFDQYAHKS